MGYGNIKPPLGCTVDRGHPLARSIAGLWLFNEGAGNTLRDAVLDQPMTGTGSPLWQNGTNGPCANFDGSTQKYIAPNAALYSFSRNFSVTVRFNYTTIGSVNYPGLVSKDAAGNTGWLIGTKGTTGLFGITRPSLSQIVYGATTVVVSRWYTGTVTVGTGSTANVRVYLNGVLDGSGTTTEGLATATNALRFGADLTGSSGQFPGRIEYGAIHATELQPAEVMALHAQPYAMVYKPRRRTTFFVPSGLQLASTF